MRNYGDNPKSSPLAVAEETEGADAVVGAVLVPGAEAPKVVTGEMVANMVPGSVIVDLAVDQGGCVETSVETSWADPVRVVDDIVHFAVGNVPAAVPRTATEALSAAVTPYVRELASRGVIDALRDDEVFAAGLNLYKGEVTHAAVAAALGADHMPFERLW